MSFSFRLSVFLCVCFLCALAMPGCGGCIFNDDSAQKDEDQRPNKDNIKPPFQSGRIVIRPSDDTPITKNSVKPGHWIAGTQSMRANNYDFQAEIQSYNVDRYRRPMEIENTKFRMESWRPASLPKGQTKKFELTFYIPRRTRQESSTVQLQSSLRARRGGREVHRPSTEPTIRMPAYQYTLMVLSSDSERYGYLKHLHSIKPPSDSLDQFAPVQYYQVVLPSNTRIVPLPSSAMTWTSVAYILWDDLVPARLTPQQQQSLIDWLHWGGQLIVSGPKSLGSLRGSFLDDYLPADMVKTVELRSDAFRELNEHWSIPLQQDPSIRQSLQVIDDRPIIGIEMKKRDAAEYLLNCGGLVVERPVGRGRIVVTAFHLADRPIVNWRSFDSFFNACLLRRPRRVFKRQEELLGPRAEWLDYPDHTTDARLMSTLRFFSRDVGMAAQVSVTRDEDGDEAEEPRASPQTAIAEPEALDDDWHFGGYQEDDISGVGGWNDSGATAQAIRESMDEAAGIEVPRADFVLRVLAVYLFVLVPLNWCVFRVIRRVEWAWVATPVIAIAGAVAVVRLAQLDIGFARSRTEIAILELQGGHRRAHLSRYTRLYTSLATSYSFSFSDENTVARPFAVKEKRPLDPYERTTTVRLRSDDGITLDGFKVPSNAERAIHSEQFYDLGGRLTLTGSRQAGYGVDNETELTLNDVGVLHRTEDGVLRRAWVDSIEPQTTVPLRFEDADTDKLFFEQWNRSTTMRDGEVPEGELNLGQFVNLAVRGLRIRQGECRLIAWSRDELPGISIRPRASQSNLRTLVVAHLAPGQLPAAAPDVNSIADVTEEDYRKATDPTYDPYAADLSDGGFSDDQTVTDPR